MIQICVKREILFRFKARESWNDWFFSVKRDLYSPLPTSMDTYGVMAWPH